MFRVELKTDQCDYEKDYMEIKFNSDDDLPFNKPLKFHMMTTIISFVFEEDGKLYPQVFLDDALYELVYKNASCKQHIKCQNMIESIFLKELILIKQVRQKSVIFVTIGQYFKDIGFKYERYLCNGCHDLMQKVVSFNNVAIVYVKGSAYRINFWYMSKDDATDIINGSNLVDKMSVLEKFLYYI